MSPKWNYILGAVTITVIVGGTIYAIKKSKDVAKAEEEAITVEEAMEIVADRRREREEEDEVRFEKPIEVVVTGPSTIKGKEHTEDEFDPSNVDAHLEDMEEDIDEEDPLKTKYEHMEFAIDVPTVEPLDNFMYVEEGIDPKEDKELRHPKDSVEAKHQYIRMELADFHHDEDEYRILLQMYEIPFIPMNSGDEFLRTQIIDYKVQFFGFGSKWNREVSFADVVNHYARAATFNCGESQQFWIEHFIAFTNLDWESPFEDIERVVYRMNNHSYFNEERQTHGLFGLTSESMDSAIRIASESVDRSVTYEIEFNEFLKSNI